MIRILQCPICDVWLEDKALPFHQEWCLAKQLPEPGWFDENEPPDDGGSAGKTTSGGS